MNEVDMLVTQKFIAFREKALEVIRKKHPYVINIIDAVFANKENRIGLQVTDEGNVIGEYTFHTKGIHIANAETGKLDSWLKHPLLDLTIRPYAVIEKSIIEELVSDDRIVKEPFPTLMKYLPDITIKFMR
jgi:hypothetical protein